LKAGPGSGAGGPDTPLDPGKTACDKAARSEQETSFADRVHGPYHMGLTSVDVKLAEHEGGFTSRRYPMDA